MGDIVDLGIQGVLIPDVVIVDSNLIIAHLLSNVHSPFPHVKARADQFFRMLRSIDGIGIVTSPSLNETLHFAIKSMYRVAIDNHRAMLRQAYPQKSRFDWIDLYKQAPGLLRAYRTDLLDFCQYMTANNLYVLQPDDVAQEIVGDTLEERLVGTIGQYGLDSYDAAMLLEARHAGITSIASLGADLQRAATDFDIYTWLT
jgi:predicted nucleic acid-binding protein